MQTSEQWLNYQKLEQIATSPNRWHWRRGRDRLKSIFPHRNEPRVWQSRGGNFKGYDPVSGESVLGQEVRIWLEQRYYR